MERNLLVIVERLRASGARVLIAGMRVPTNYGEAYSQAFRDVFPDVARRTGSALMPFLLDGVAADARLNQPDGIHPNAAGHRVIAERVWHYLAALIAR
jgi:acyl-CoA thioesterase-1